MPQVSFNWEKVSTFEAFLLPFSCELVVWSDFQWSSYCEITCSYVFLWWSLV